MKARQPSFANGVFFALIAASLAASSAPSDAPYSVAQEYLLGGPGGWDLLMSDPDHQRLFITRADRIMVVSTADGSLVGTIPETAGVHGVALAANLGKGFSSNGRSDNVTVFDLQTLKPLETIAVKGQNPDVILFEAASGRLLTFNGRSQDISFIDPEKREVVAKLPAGGKPEFAVADGTGKVFVNIEDKAQILVFDARTARQIAVWPLAGCEEPTGLAMDVAHRRLFSVCGNQVMAITNADTGKSVARVKIGQGPDGAAFDAERGLVFSPNGRDGTLTIVHEDDPDHYSVAATIATRKSARTMALDAKTHRVYLVSAEFGPAPAPTPEHPHPRGAVLENSFRLTVIARQK